MDTAGKAPTPHLFSLALGVMAALAGPCWIGGYLLLSSMFPAPTDTDALPMDLFIEQQRAADDAAAGFGVGIAFFVFGVCCLAWHVGARLYVRRARG